MSMPVPQSAFTVGEVSPRLKGRIDLDQYGFALEKARNFAILPQGPLRKRSGTNFIAKTKFQKISNTETVAWIDFIFSSVQSYAIEAGHQYFRFYVFGAQIKVSSVPYEIATPYLHTEVSQLKFVQTSDVMYIVHKNYPVYKLTRLGETNWTLVPVTFIDGPYLDVNRTDTYMSWSTIFKPSGVGTPANSWDNTDITFGNFGTTYGIYEYDFTGVTEYAVNGYSITFTGSISGSSFVDSAARTPRKWTFESQRAGSAVWVILDSRDGESDWIPGETRQYEYPNISETPYNKYRLNVASINGGTRSEIWEVALKMQNIFSTYVFSSIIGINKGVGFTSADIGRYLRFQGPDSYWRYIKIQGVINSTTITGVFYGYWLQSTGSATNWRLGAFSDATGYPSSIALFEERLVLAGTKLSPRTLWFTATNDFENYQLTDPLTDASPVTITLTGERLDEIVWLNPGKGLFIGTASGVTSITGGQEAITYKNSQQVSQTNYGASPARPIRIGPALLYQSSFLSCLRELLFNFNDDTYDAPNLTLLNEHLYKAIMPSVWQSTPYDLVITPSSDGTCAVMAYERAQKIYGSTVWETDGLFKAVCSIPNAGNYKDDLYIICSRIINNVDSQYIEYFNEAFENQPVDQAHFTDCALSYNGALATVFSGLSHLEGKTVRVVGFVGGETSPKIYTLTVTGASVTTPVALTKVDIGLPYTAYVTILPSRSPGPNGATSFNSKNRIDGVIVDVFRTMGLILTINGGAPENLIPRGSADKMDQAPPLYTGILAVDADGSWDADGVITITSADPLPCMIRLIMPNSDKGTL